MRRILLLSLAMSAFAAPLAFAQNLGVLSNEKTPQNLLPASEFLKQLAEPNAMESRNTVTTQGNHHALDANRAHNQESDFWDWGSMYGAYSYFPYYYPSYYYPYYNYSSYYYPGYYGWGWLDDQSSTTHTPTTNARLQTPTDRAHTPVVCFSSDSAGAWFASADIASNVANTQEAANNECLASGANCSQSLGCAVAHR